MTDKKQQPPADECGPKAPASMEVWSRFGLLGTVLLKAPPTATPDSDEPPPEAPPEIDIGVFLIFNSSAVIVGVVWSLDPMSNANRTEYWALGINFKWPSATNTSLTYTFEHQSITFTDYDAFKAYAVAKTGTPVEVHKHSTTRL